MKETPLVIAAMMLLCFPAYSQEADDLGNSAAELTVVARAEYPLDNTSLYTLFEGNLSDNLSYSVANHWLSVEPGLLYANTLRSDDVNWLDWAYLTWSFDSFEISAGKDMLPWGTMEMDEYDFDIHKPFSSSVWNSLPIYQWGVRGSWLPTEELTFDLRLSSSPYGEHPFASGLFALGARAHYTAENTDFMVAYNAMQWDKGEAIGAFSAGIAQTFGDLTLGVDFNSRPGDDSFIFDSGFATALKATYAVSDEITVKGHASYEKYDRFDWYDARTGAVVEWCPIENLRVHGLAGWSFGDFYSGALYSIGVTYTFSTSFGK